MVVTVATVVVRRCRPGGSAGVVVGGRDRWDERARNDGSRVRRIAVRGRGRRREDGGGGGTELATETVIWRPSQNGDILCHSPRR